MIYASYKNFEKKIMISILLIIRNFKIKFDLFDPNKSSYYRNTTIVDRINIWILIAFDYIKSYIKIL
jgi:hypothetical protein